jgi:hypothetical protein
MPSYPSDDFDNDGEAWAHLEQRGFTQFKGVIRPPAPDYEFDRKTSEAVNYLVGEWDWAYEGH